MQYEDLRREAYIEAINLKGENKFVSTFGRVPWELIYSFSLFSVPSYGIDLYVMENFKKDENLCDLLNSTKIYLREDKCPLMFSSSFFVVDDFCQREMTYYIGLPIKKSMYIKPLKILLAFGRY